MDANTEFLKAVSLLENIIAEPIEYRLHYNEHGEIYLCSMQQHPENTQYLVVTEQEYQRYFDYIVVKGKLKLIDRSIGFRVQLKPSNTGYAVVRNHASVLLEPGETYEDIEYYDATN